MEIAIIYEDEAVVVVDKPAGVICNRASTVQQETLQDWMDHRFRIKDLGFENEEEK